jgi:hypothetical protein
MPIETSTKIGLISNALILLGEKPLNALNDNRYGASVGSNLFEMIYENELQSNRWRFAMTKEALSQLVSAPLNEWQFAYQLPADMLLPIGVFPVCDYEIYADHLYTDAASVELDMLFKPEVGEIPAYFATLMTYRLARDMAKPITESGPTGDRWGREYNTQRAVAMFADAQGRPAKPIMRSPFTDNR